MAFNRDFELNEAQLEEFLTNATERVRTSENVDLLSDLNKLFKKNVPLTVRKYVIAYLLKEALKHYHPFNNRRDRFDRNERNDRNDRNDRNQRQRQERNFRQERTERAAEPAETTEEERPRHPRVEIPEDQATSIFISIGKNRRVYPRDLVGILIAIAGIDRERIGDIKVLANYSFVQLYTEDAQTAIDKLNGYDYRGRKLAVSYSRQKSDSEAAEEATEETSYEAESQNEYSAEAQEMAAEDAAAYAAAEKAAADKEPFGMN
ncbi:DbpA RNA binding domain-containing protein [Treponema bryantii]|uniref:DbpA RNA binding domain-containing protein n=1 Tax=Treponema bryantii TaxID=163 RepID=A0A1I3IDT5_9SPIR|nr:DbpA RNA binding domain-containing protein [Treponema bryantii]SFI46128.1 DbpA RNA binding domain-containing protein [Treponema bryantii]